MSGSNYLSIITKSELDQLENLTKNGLPHPVVALIHNPDSMNTVLAAESIARNDQSWLSGLKPRLLDSTDFTNASSALGEIRAYGALLETGMTVSPGPSVPGRNVIPEFEVNGKDDPVIVEVHSRQLDNEQTQSIGEHFSQLHSKHQATVQTEKTSKSGKVVITTGELEIVPFGAPNQNKRGDSILTNAISRIASIKKSEKQIDHQKPFLLWLDLQDPTVWRFPISEEQLSPLYTEDKDGAVGSGALWFALYGRKDDIMIESQGYDYCVIKMLHDGRFADTIQSHNEPTRVSAVVYSMPRATVLMENPLSSQPLPPKFRASLLRTPFFKLDRSIVEWEPGIVSARIALDRRTTESAAKALLKFNPH